MKEENNFSAISSSSGSFQKLLFRWRGSVYKLVRMEYLVFITCYYIIAFIYRSILDLEQQEYFEKIANFCELSNKNISMAFVLGFFVTSIVSKWWQIYATIPCPDTIALLVNSNIRGEDDATKQLKKTVLRHCNLSLILTFHQISNPVRAKYPSLDDLVRPGYLTKKEKQRIITDDDGVLDDTSTWLPISWAAELLVKAEKDSGGKFTSSKIIDELNKFRSNCAQLLQTEHYTPPLAYIQVCTIAVYVYFFSCLFGRQWLIRDDKIRDLNLFFPFLTTLEFILYMGWLKVAESLINPFGSDDDDLDLNKIFERNLKIINTMDRATYDGIELESKFIKSEEDANNITTTTAHFENETSTCSETSPLTGGLGGQGGMDMVQSEYGIAISAERKY